MSYDYSTRKNKHPKIGFQNYLYNEHEPHDNYGDDVSLDDEELAKDARYMRRRFRKIAQKLRDDI